MDKKLKILFYTILYNNIKLPFINKDKMTINNRNKNFSKNTNIIENISKSNSISNLIDPMRFRFNGMIEDLRNDRLSIMNVHENFCHIARIFREDGKEQCFTLRYWL